MKKIGPLDLYRRLPRTNCGACGEKTCMAFAVQLLERKCELKDCPYIEKKNMAEMERLLEPALRLTEIGIGENVVRMGGEDVMYRHELTYFHKSAFFIDMHDEMSEKDLKERTDFINHFRHERVGETLTLQGIAIRNKSNDAQKFAECVGKVCFMTDKPLMLCSWEVEAHRMALKFCSKRRPLLYAATKENWESMGRLALKYDCPLAAFADNDPDELKTIVSSLLSLGVNQMALDPGTNPSNGGFSETFGNLVMLRKSTMEGDEKILNFPVIGVASSAYLEGNDDEKKLKEVMLGTAMISRFCNLVVLRSTQMWSLLPLLTLRQNIYTDPRKPKAVKSGLHVMGNASEDSYVMCTTNFALTYYTVESDILKGKIDCYLVVFDTEGLSVDSSIAGGQLDALKASCTIRESGIEEKVLHKRIIIPGLAARISADLARLSGWEVIVGPRDSSGIPAFVEKLEKEKGGIHGQT